jgi:hypothetical protein
MAPAHSASTTELPSNDATTPCVRTTGRGTGADAALRAHFKGGDADAGLAELAAPAGTMIDDLFADRSVPREPETRTSENGRFSTYRQA